MPTRSSFFPIAFAIFFVLWTIALLVPIPQKSANDVFGSGSVKFVFAKTLHVSAYAFLTVLGGLAASTSRQRWRLIALMSFHAFATEYLQLFVERGGSFRDVGLDHLGIVIGLLIGRKLPPEEARNHEAT
ncbi:MAG: VanZ family protein [Planctomycetes bacterium]|nr:VanZ family protein [Planctomycetota bacterium]